MKNVNLKKPAALAASAALTLSLAACGGGSSGTPAPAVSPAGEDAPVYTVAVVKQMDHASLDEIAAAVTARLDEIAAQEGAAIQYEVYSGQNDQTTLRQIGNQAIVERGGRHHPHRHHRRPGHGRPVLRRPRPRWSTPPSPTQRPPSSPASALSPAPATPLDTELILDMMLAQNPDTAKVGLLYSLSEPNSEVPIAEAKAYLDAAGIAYTEATANTNDEVIAAASSLIAEGGGRRLHPHRQRHHGR